MSDSAQELFSHEKLEVYRQSIEFIGWLPTLLDGSVAVGAVKDQLDRASTSIALNIAEGDGKYSLKDRCRFFDIAHGSALECAAGLDVLVARDRVSTNEIQVGKEMIGRIVIMLMGLIKRNSPRTYERRSDEI
jgi:four helix bundle protein